ncbi:MAG: AI-2E family transporter [Bacteroidota bacterium]
MGRVTNLLYILLVVVLAGAAISGLLFLMWYFSNIVLYIVISVVISAILRPLTNYLSSIQLFKVRIPRFLSILVSFATLVFVVSLFILLFVPLIAEQTRIVANIDYVGLFERVKTPLDNVEEFLIDYQITDEEKGFIADNIQETITSMIANIEFGNIFNSVISVTGSLFIGALAVTFITFFLLYEMGSMRKRVISFVPNKYFEVSMAAFGKIERLLSNYLIGILLQMLAVFSIASLGLTIVGVKYALTVAVFAALANLIPYLGPILGATFGIIVGLSTRLDLATTQEYFFFSAKIVLIFATVQLIDNLVLQPLIFSKSVKAHPLEIFIIIFAGASLAGIPGMIAAIPAYTILRVSFIEAYEGYKQYNIFKTKVS